MNIEEMLKVLRENKEPVDPELSYLTNKEEFNRKLAIARLKKQLEPLNEDLVQFTAGVKIPDIETKKAEFRRIHGDIRELEGKPRERPDKKEQ